MNASQAVEPLRRAVDQVVRLLRSDLDPEAPALGSWSVAELAMHLSQVWLALPGLAAEDLSETREIITGTSSGSSLIKDFWDLTDMTVSGVKADPERNLAVIADRIETRAADFFLHLGPGCDEQLPWLVEGVRVPRSILVCHLLNETVVHGYDLARTGDVAWTIEPESARMVLQGFLIPASAQLGPRVMVDQDQAAGVRVSYEIRIRGGNRYRFDFNDGTLTIEEASTCKAHCYISADPVAFLLVAWGRETQHKAIMRGKLLAWGPKPWMALKLRGLLRNP